MTKNLGPLALPLLLFIYILQALAYSTFIPLGEAPDEVSHFAYVQYLVRNQNLPVGLDASSGEAHQPPLYYLLGAAVTFWIPDQRFEFIANPDWRLDDPATPNLLLHTRAEAFPYRGGALAWHLVRLISVLCGAITVGATYSLARRIFAAHPHAAPAAAAFIAFLPSFAFLSGVVNNDNLLIALSALTVHFFLGAREQARDRESAFLGVLLGLAFLAKVSALALWAAIGIAIIFWRDAAPPTRVVRRLAVIYSTALVVVSPWLAYNWIVRHDVLDWARLLQIDPRIEPLRWRDGLGYLVGMYQSFWGKFGGATSLKLPPLAYAAFAGFLLLGLLGTLRFAQQWRAGKLPASFARALGFAALLGGLLIAAQLRLFTQLLAMDQARQVFAGLPLLSIFAAGGILVLSEQKRELVARVLIVGIMLIGLSTLVYTAAFYVTASVPRPIAANGSFADFGREIRITDYRIGERRVKAGQSVAVLFVWQALTQPREVYWLSLQLVNDAGPIGQSDGVPTAGRVTTDWWQAGQVFSSRHSLAIPRGTAPGTYRLQIGLHPYARYEWLRVRGQDMFPLGEIEIAGEQ